MIAVGFVGMFLWAWRMVSIPMDLHLAQNLVAVSCMSLSVGAIIQLLFPRARYALLTMSCIGLALVLILWLIVLALQSPVTGS
jgi:hypothetical protein